MPENNISLSAGYTLESISRTIGNNVLDTIFNFIQPRITSARWGDRYIGMIAFGSIIDGPVPSDIINIIKGAYFDIVNMIADSVPKVRQTVAFVFYKLSEFVPEIVFSSQDNLDLFINQCIAHIGEHHLISNLIIGALKNLFVHSARLNCSHLLNPYFQLIFAKLIETMYR
jgi:importin subunit beta-1